MKPRFSDAQLRERSQYAAVSGEAFADWRDMREGDSVVHLFHGIGKYLGLEQSLVDGVAADFLVLEYAGKIVSLCP